MAIKKLFKAPNNISLKGSLHLPGDKSIGIRSLIILSQSYGISNVSNISDGEDVQTALANIKKLKITVQKTGPSDYKIFGLGIGFKPFKGTLNFNNSGTTLRLLTGLLSTSPVEAKLIGDASLSKRPIRIISLMEKFFASFFPKNKDYLPIKLIGYGDAVQNDISITKPSAQIISACILAGMNAHGLTSITAPNTARDHTERMLKYLKYPIQIKNHGKMKTIKIMGKQFLSAEKNYIVPGDPSSAAFIIVLGALTKNSSVTLHNILLNEKRIGFLKVLKKMGANIQIKNKKIKFGESVGDIEVKSSMLRGVSLSAEIIPSIIDEIPILMVAAAFADGKSYFPNLDELKIKESDRLAAMEINLKKVGVSLTRTSNSLTILGLDEDFYSNKVATVDSFKDHRIAMSFAVMAMASKKKIHIKDFDCARVSYPNFLSDIEKIRNKSFKQIIVGLDGPVSSGKTSVAKYAANKLQNSLFLDSGLLYRFLAKKQLQQKQKKININKLITIAKKISLNDLKSAGLHKQNINLLVSKIAKIPQIRKALLPVQRKIIFNTSFQNVFVCGRDINSKVAQNADLKIYIDAPTKNESNKKISRTKKN